MGQNNDTRTQTTRFAQFDVDEYGHNMSYSNSNGYRPSDVYSGYRGVGSSSTLGVQDGFYSGNISNIDSNNFNSNNHHQFSQNKPLPNASRLGTINNDISRGRHNPLSTVISKSWWRKRHPWFVWLMSTVQIAVFIAELGVMGKLTGSPIQTKPTFNPMIGPSSYVMINMGARFTPCMHEIKGITDTQAGLLFPCPNSTTVDTDTCSLGELCGFGGFHNKIPNQWWRFIVPMFLHAGFVHIGFNMLLQLRLGAELEKEIGIFRFVIVYVASGISGFLLGGNFTPDGIASTGASGALFGVIALDLLDLLFNWSTYRHPKRVLAMLIVEIIISFVIGLLPGLDNFAHIGGFAMGLLTGTAILRSPLKIRKLRRPGLNSVEVINLSSKNSTTSYDYSDEQELLAQQHYQQQQQDELERRKAPRIHWTKNPASHFVGQSKWWYAWLGVRFMCVGLAIAYFAGLFTQFYNGGGHCSWCRYLSCLPVHGWCDQGNISVN